MAIGTSSSLLSAAIALLLCGLLTGTAGERSDGGTCDLSIFRTLPHAVMRNIQHFQNHYVGIRSPAYSNPLVASLDVLKGLRAPERRVLVRAEFEVFTQVLGNVAEETLGTFGKKACNTLTFITTKLTECALADALNTDQYSTELSLLLQRLNDVKENPDSSADRVVVDLARLLNEHLTCVAQGPSC